MKGPGGGLPGLFHSYFGHAIARCDGRIREGLELCEYSVEIEFYQPENYLNLARTRLLAGNRRGACACVERGLMIDPSHAGLHLMRKQLGVRRAVPLPFLARRKRRQSGSRESSVRCQTMKDLLRSILVSLLEQLM